MTIHYITRSIRNIKHNKQYSLLNIGGFAAGFAVCMVLLLYTYKEYTVDTGFKNHSTIYRLIDTKNNSSRIDFDFAQQLEDQYSNVKLAVPFNYISLSEENVFIKTINSNDYIQSTAMVSTTNNFFKAFSVPIISGNPDAPFPDLNSVVITQSVAIKLFGRTEVVGEIINLGDIFELPISAVAEDLPVNSSFDADIFFNGENENFRFSRSSYNNIIYNPVDIFIQLNDKNDTEQFLTLINQKIPVNKSRLENIRLQPLTDIYMETDVEGNRNKSGSIGMIRIFLAIAILIMLLSVINYVNLSMSKQLSTLKTIAIQVTNGANKRQLRGYYFTDVSISVLIAFILALGISIMSLPYASQLLNTFMDPKELFSPVMISLFLAILFIVVLFSAFAPGYIVSRFDLQQMLGKKHTAAGRQFGKRVLTVFQLSSAMALLIGLIVIQKQIHYVKTQDLGFDKEQLVRIELHRDMKNVDALKQRVDQLPFVLNSSLSLGSPGSVYMIMSSDLSDKSNFDVNSINVDEEFLETFGIQLQQGREFEITDFGNACYINETAYKIYGWDNLENRIFNNGKEGGYNVIGVVKDFNTSSLHNMMEPVCLLYNTNYTSLSIRLIHGDLSEQLKRLQDIWKEFIPENPMMFTFYDSIFDAFYKKEERQGKAIAIFSIITFIITCLGLIGQILQTTSERIKEIGIRKVNGAKIWEVVLMLNRDFVKWVAIAFVIATPIAWYAMNRWLQNFAYKTEMGWWIFALAGLLTLAIALLTVSWQSWRAARRNPVEALRYE